MIINSSRDGALPCIYVSPSNFAFLWEECPRCYYLETLGWLKRPRTPFPSIFNAIDHAMKDHFSDGRWHELNGSDHALRVESAGKKVQSVPIQNGSSLRDIGIRGFYDSIVCFDDGSTAVCDFKTAPVKAEHLGKYARQLEAYAFALENPWHKKQLSIDRLGLAVFEPTTFSNSSEKAAFEGRLTWIEVQRDASKFHEFVREVSSVLSGERAPIGSETCTTCAYLAEASVLAA